LRVEALDVADPTNVAALAQPLRGVPVDILVNHAGVFDREGTTIANVDFAMMERTLAVNTLGPLRFTRVLLPKLQRRRR
jgi:short-subunit dehydrogenase